MVEAFAVQHCISHCISQTNAPKNETCRWIPTKPHAYATSTRFAAPTRPQRQITSNGVIAVIMAQDGTIFTAYLGTALDDP